MTSIKVNMTVEGLDDVVITRERVMEGFNDSQEKRRILLIYGADLG